MERFTNHLLTCELKLTTGAAQKKATTAAQKKATTGAAQKKATTGTKRSKIIQKPDVGRTGKFA